MQIEVLMEKNSKLQLRIRELEMINENHRKLNGELRKEMERLQRMELEGYWR